MAVYVTSDLHWGHRNIHKFRTHFNTPEENTEVLKENILSLLNKRDTLYILGDTMFSEDGFIAMIEVASYIHNIHMVLGNHCTETNTRINYVTELQRMFSHVKVHGMTKYKRSGYSKAWMTHTPMHPLELRGGLNVHGHTHNFIIHNENYFNACPENTEYKPVDIEDILKGYRGTLFDKSIAKQSEILYNKLEKVNNQKEKSHG